MTRLLSEVARAAQEFVLTRQSLALSTVNNAGEPLASYAPFYRSETGDFYIFASTLAAHTENLKSAAASILIIEDEQNIRQIYARMRLCFQCSAVHIPPDNFEFEMGKAGLKHKHGEIINTLAELADFKLVKLSPLSGRYIQGFGQAYRINPALTEAVPISN